MVHSVSIAVATTLFHYAHDYHYQKATTISNFFAPIVELLSYTVISVEIATPLLCFLLLFISFLVFSILD